jgi:trigger factor
LLEPANRPAQEGDVVIADLVAKQDDEVMLDREGAELLLDPETLYPDTPFVEHLVGMSAGEEKSFEISVSDDDYDDDDDDDAKGREATVSYEVTVHEVKSRYLPPLNDDLAREEGDFETLLELRIDARQRLTKAAQKKADAEYVNQLFDMILEGTTVVYPPAAVEQEIDRTMEEMGQHFEQQGWALEDLLKLQGKTVEMIREESRPRAEEQIKRREVTLALVRAEQLSMSDDELDQLVDDRMGEMGELDEELGKQLREFYSSGQGRMIMANDMLMNKFSERLKAIGQGKAPELPDLPEEEEEEE